MNAAERAELLARYVAQMRRDAWVPGLATEQLPDVTRYYDVAQREVLIMWHRFVAGEAEAVVARELRFFENAGGFTWKIYADDEPANLAQILIAAGLEEEHENGLMVAPAPAMASWQSLPDKTVIHELKDATEIHLLRDVWESVWPGNNGGWLDVLGECLDTHPTRLRILVALVDGKPAASGYIVLDPRGNFAYLGGGGVVANIRGKGLYRALVHARARIAVSANICHLAVEASPDSRPILAKLGFDQLTTLRFYSRS